MEAHYIVGKLPSFQFYPGDWLRDSVSGCSIAAQGLWLRMMIVAHDGSPYGHLAQGGKALQPEVIARRCGVALDEYLTLLAELTAAGVPDTSNGSLISRRMVRDQRERDAARGRKQRERERHVTPLSRDCHADVTAMSQRSSSSSSSSLSLPPPPAGARAATAIDRIQAMLGRDLSSSDRLTITRAEDRYGAMGTVEIHGQQVGYVDLFDRAVGVAIAEPGFEWRTAGAFTKYIAAIVQRAVDARLWPGERAERVAGPERPDTSAMDAGVADGLRRVEERKRKALEAAR